MKVNWIKSIACGFGFASLSVLPQSGFAQSGQYIPPSTWNNFNVGTSTQSQPTQPVQQDPASPHFRTVSTAVPRSLQQPLQMPQTATQPTYSYAPAQTNNATPQYGYAAPQTASAPQATYNAPPSFSVARRNDSLSMIEGAPNGYVEPLPTGPVSHGAPLASEQFHNHAQEPIPSPYMEAASAPWDAGSCATGACGSGMSGGDCGPVRPPLFSWFGGGNVLFWSMENSDSHRMVLATGMPTTTLLNTRQVDPGSDIGYDVFFGRYFGCGKYALSLNYLNFDPDSERAMVTGAALAYYAAMPAFEDIGYYVDPNDPGSAYTSMKDVYDNMTSYAIDRDVSFQGIEMNLWSFGFGGARRLAPACGTGLSCGFHNPFSRTCNTGCAPACPPKYGFGGFGGPLERPCAGSTQLALSQGFRWFQFNDDFRFSAYDGVNSAMFDSNAQNDLFGYQLGGRWNYCATSRINLGMGAKFGAYANNVEVHQRVGNDAMPARYQSATPASRRYVNQTDTATVLSGLGEIDLGAGFRLTDCWTVRGGYRVMGISGVATSVGMIKHEMFSENLMAKYEANDSVLLHGAYIGSEFNW